MYIECFEHYFLANNIQAAKKVSVLFSVMGPKTYGLLHSLVVPTKPGTMEYDDVIAVLQAHFRSKTARAEKFRYHKRNQGEGETVALYVAVLKRLSGQGEFGGYLEDELRDRFVCGLKCETVQKRLLTEKDLTFQKAVDHCVSAETAAHDVQQLNSSLKVNAVLSQRDAVIVEKQIILGMTAGLETETVISVGGKATQKGCVGVNPKSSQYREHKKKEGKPEQKGTTMRHRMKVKKKKINPLETNESRSEVTKSDTDNDLGLYTLFQKGKYARITVVPLVNGKKMEMELDTGATVSLIPWEQSKRNMTNCPLYLLRLCKNLHGEPLSPEGVVNVRVELNKKRAILPLHVVKVDAPPLFGREWL